MQRIEYLDIAKGIAIILVVIGHSSCPRMLWGGVYSFHMPLFFLISGCFFQPINSFSKYRDFIFKKFKGLYLPFLAWSLVFLAAGYIAFHGDIEGNYQTSHECLHRLYKIVFFMSDTQILGFWFIQVLFVDFIFLGTLSLLLSSKVRDLNLILVIIILAVEMIQMGIRGRSNSLSMFLVSSTYLLIGGYLRILKSDKCYSSKSLLFFLTLFTLSIGFFYNDEIPNLTKSNWASYIALSIPGIICVLGISKRIALNGNIRLKKIFKYIGRNTYTILALHGVVIFQLRKLLVECFVPDSIKCMIYVLTALTVSLIMSLLLERLKAILLSQYKK